MILPRASHPLRILDEVRHPLALEYHPLGGSGPELGVVSVRDMLRCTGATTWRVCARELERAAGPIAPREPERAGRLNTGTRPVGVRLTRTGVEQTRNRQGEICSIHTPAPSAG